MKNIVLAVTIMLSTLGVGQSKFSATSNGDTGGTIFQHYDGCSSGQVQNSAVSTSSACGFTSPVALTSLHLGGKDYAGFNIGNVQFGTGLFLNGNFNTVALFDSADLSYVTVGTNGSCGQFKHDGVTCKPNGFVPNSATTFVGIFVGTVSWNSLPDGSHTLSGTVKGIVNNSGNSVFLSFVATTVPETHGEFQNGHERISTVSLKAL